MPPPELRVVCNQERKTGKAPPKRLTTHQRAIVERLLAAHGEDVEVGQWCSSGSALLDLHRSKSGLGARGAATRRVALLPHPHNTQAMFRDRKLNPMQHSSGKLRELLEAYHHWAPASKHDFRVPNKPPRGKLIR
jgi:hypothetical protein